MDNIKKVLYASVIMIVYFYLLESAFTLLTKANTLSNFLGFIGAAILIALGIVFVYNLIKEFFAKDEYESIKDKEWREHLEKQMKAMQENITKHNAYSDVIKKKAKESKPLVEGKTKSQTKKGTEKTKAVSPPKPPKLK